MLTDLHLHLEPGIRWARRAGKVIQPMRDREEFFRAHDLHARRPSMGLRELAQFIVDLQAEQRAHGISYAEVRISPRRFLAEGIGLEDILRTASDTAIGLENPEIRLILLINRDSPQSFVDACEDAIRRGLPTAFVGIDLAGDELRFPDVGKFEHCFAEAHLAGLGVTVHAGEFGRENDVWAAVDRLGAKRIGHGVAVHGSRDLARRLISENILIEVCITSNVALGAVRTVAAHPLPWILRHDIDVCLNTDVPLHIGASMRGELRRGAWLVRNDRVLIEFMASAAARHVFRRQAARAES